jgi:dolichyl-phosphate-mannose--protein O-mannosyl transferase
MIAADGPSVSAPARARTEWRRRAWLVPMLCFVGALALYLPRLSVPPRYMYDETYHAYTAARYVAGDHNAYLWNIRAPRAGSAYTWNHPPVGLWLIAAGIAVWGDRALGWRFASAVFGAFGVVLAYVLARRLSGNRAAAELTAALLLLEGLWFVQSRIAMLDVFGAVFMMAALLGLHGYLVDPPRAAARWLGVTAVCLGLAIATKWNAAYPSLCVGLVVLWVAVRRSAPGTRARAVAGILAALGLLPALVYLAAYVPFFATGHTIGQFVELQHQIYHYHTTLRATHTYQSRWWEWPLLLRPLWYHVAYGPSTVANVYAQGNPLLVWLFVPAVLWLSRQWWRERNPALITLTIGFFGQWLPWALVSRIAFIYHFLPAVPFGVLAIATVVARLWGGRPAARAAAFGYVALVAAAFVFFHPIYAAVPLTPAELAARIWFPRWK